MRCSLQRLAEPPQRQELQVSVLQLLPRAHLSPDISSYLYEKPYMTRRWRISHGVPGMEETGAGRAPPAPHMHHSPPKRTRLHRLKKVLHQAAPVPAACRLADFRQVHQICHPRMILLHGKSGAPLKFPSLPVSTRRPMPSIFAAAACWRSIRSEVALCGPISNGSNALSGASRQRGLLVPTLVPNTRVQVGSGA